jgi:hypothetical protein
VQQVLADLHAEREKSPELRKVWQSISLNYSVRACVIFMLASFYITLAPGTSEAAPLFFSTLAEYKFPIICTFLALFAVRRQVAIVPVSP